MSQQILGYTYGTSAVAKSPVSLADFGLMQKARYSARDVKYLRPRTMW